MAETASYVEAPSMEAPTEVQAIAQYQPSGIPVAFQTGPGRPNINIGLASYDAVQGKPRALARLALGTVLRAGAIGIGCYAVGIRDKKQLVLGSLAASAGISLVLTGYHAARTGRTW